MSVFDEKAKTWDDKSERFERAKLLANNIIENVSGLSSMEAFEYGCGTGLLSFQLQSYLKHITLADTSKGMLKVLEQKIQDSQVTNMTSMQLNLEESEPPYKNTYDLIYNSNTLHHIENYERVLQQLYYMLKFKGYLFVFDLYAEDGSFHGEEFTGHNGFDPEQLKKLLIHIGFSEVSHQHIYSINKQTENGEYRSYPVFAMKCRK